MRKVSAAEKRRLALEAFADGRFVQGNTSLEHMSERPSRRLTILGGVGTLVWAAIVLFFVSQAWDDAEQMNLNEWGDFLAGVSAPLALGWLVIGYFQHGHELRLNTRALRLQQEDLKRQAEEISRLVEATEDHTRVVSSTAWNQQIQDFGRRR